MFVFRKEFQLSGNVVSFTAFVSFLGFVVLFEVTFLVEVLVLACGFFFSVPIYIMCSIFFPEQCVPILLFFFLSSCYVAFIPHPLKVKRSSRMVFVVTA